MIANLLISFALMSLCVVTHAVGIMYALKRLGPALPHIDWRAWRPAWLMVRVASWLVFLHLVEIALWAAFYTWRQAIPDVHDAFYFSAVTYTTTGYGDLVLPPAWRLLGGIEALTGILMCGWSTAFFFALVSRLHRDAHATAGAMPRTQPPRE